MDKIRNFCIIAHIDHGKSTLADRLLEITGTVAKRDMKAQLLDTMELEREKGITIKLQPARMNWKGHELNLIDTPGHVDFSYEVSRSLEAVEGAILVVDASQGIQAQTLANVYMAIEAGLHIIPVMNKIDLPAAEPERVAQEIGNLLGVDPLSVSSISAKTGEGVDDLLDRIIKDVPEPTYEEGPTRALIFDSIYDGYRGVILYVRVVSGTISTNSEITLMQSKSDSLALEVGHLSPARVEDPEIGPGQIGFITTNIKSVQFARVGDTVTLTEDQATSPLPGWDGG